MRATPTTRIEAIEQVLWEYQNVGILIEETSERTSARATVVLRLLGVTEDELGIAARSMMGKIMVEQAMEGG